MKILVCPCTDKEKSIALMPRVMNVLHESSIVPVMFESDRPYFSDDRAEYIGGSDICSDCDMVMTVGGDGMILKWSKKAAAAGKPIVGINTGRLGFMTTLDSYQTEFLSALAEGNYTLSRRMMLSAEARINGQPEYNTALNDVVVFKDRDSKLPEFTVKINGITVTKVRADGIIFSTPTGSTAYALSAGGSIIEPSVECIQMTALCAHSLLNRPMIFSANDTVTVSYSRYEQCRANVSTDGSSGISLMPGDELVIKRSETYCELVQIGEKGFYSTVSEKLMMPLK